MIRVRVLTISDSAAAGERQDASGPEIRRQCERLGWTVAVDGVVADDCSRIAASSSDWPVAAK